MRSAERATATETSSAGLSLPASYIEVFRATPTERIRMIKTGIRAVDAKRVFADLAIAQGLALAALKLSAATVNRKAAREEALSPDESERVIGLAKLIGQVEAMIEESDGLQGFDAVGWTSRWLREPLPALGGSCPINLLETMEGQAVVATALAQIRSGAYA